MQLSPARKRERERTERVALTPRESSLRTQGPITTGAVVVRGAGSIVRLTILGVWVPAFAGTTLR